MRTAGHFRYAEKTASAIRYAIGGGENVRGRKQKYLPNPDRCPTKRFGRTNDTDGVS